MKKGRRGLISPNAKCRDIGCRTYVPSYGYYAGLPQSHCTRCGMICWNAIEQCPDFCEPIYPESDTWYRFVEWFNEKILRNKS